METLYRGLQEQPSGRVYRYTEPHLRLGDGTPLYLEWLMEGDDLTLYAVPAEPGGWLKRQPYRGQVSSLEPVSRGKALIILGLLCSYAGPTGLALRDHEACSR